MSLVIPSAEDLDGELARDSRRAVSTPGKEQSAGAHCMYQVVLSLSADELAPAIAG